MKRRKEKKSEKSYEMRNEKIKLWKNREDPADGQMMRS